MEVFFVKRKFSKRVISMLLVLVMLIGGACLSCTSAAAFDLGYISEDGMKLGYSIIKGYSKMSMKKGQYKDGKIAVYCGLDVTNLYIMGSLGWFYVTNGVDLDRAMTDNDYAMEMIAKLDSHLAGAGITNERAKAKKSEILKDAKYIYQCFDTVGLYIIDVDEKRANELMSDSGIDFVLDGGCVPKNMKDLNIDGKTDKKDAELIQQYLVKELTFDDYDENQYALFVCDINGDKTPDVRDVTEILKK